MSIVLKIKISSGPIITNAQTEIKLKSTNFQAVDIIKITLVDPLEIAETKLS